MKVERAPSQSHLVGPWPLRRRSVWLSTAITILLTFVVPIEGLAKSACVQPQLFDDLIRPSKWGPSNPKQAQRVSNELRLRLHDVDARVDIGNVGIAKVQVDGRDFEFVAHNGPVSIRGTLPALADDAPRVFKYPQRAEAKLDAWRRRNDAEAKIFEYLAPKLTPTSKGTIVLYSEKPLCHSCQGVLQQFKEKFPNINIDVRAHLAEDAVAPSDHFH